MKARLYLVVVGALMSLLLLSVPSRLAAQGIDRASYAGENLAEELRAENTPQNYNLKVGPVEVRVDATEALSVNDNINLSNRGQQADLTAETGVNFHGRWAVSDLNILTLNVGFLFQAYASHTQYDYFQISPDSEAQFNFFVGDLSFKIHDNFSYLSDPTQVGQLSNQVRLTRYQNDAGVGVQWDLGSVILALDYTHENLWVTNPLYSYLTDQTDTVAPTFTFPLNKNVSVGLQTSVAAIQYEKSFQNNSVSESVEPFVSASISKNLSVNAAAGGYFAQYSTSGSNNDPSSDVTSFVGNVGVNHQINAALSEAFTAGREYLPGLTSNYTDRIYANYSLSLQASKRINIGAATAYENLDDSNGEFRETSKRFSFNLSLNDTLSDKLSMNLSYQVLDKVANPSDLSYLQNIGTLGMQYQF
jgi:hypothetical protein